MKHKLPLLAVLVGVAALSASVGALAARAQQTSTFGLSWLTANGGGLTTPSTGGSFSATAAILPSDSGVSRGGSFSVVAGLVPPDLVAQADLALDVMATPNAVAVRGNVEYTLKVTNAGPDTATAIRLTDTLPAGATFISASVTQGSCALATGSVSCPIGTLLKGGSAVATIRVTAPASAGFLNNTASATAVQSDPRPANNTRTVQVTPVYDPTLKLVGHGTFHSPVGALVAAPVLTGPAAFGVTSQYRHGATVPTLAVVPRHIEIPPHLAGHQTALTFPLGRFTFVASAADWLVIQGARASLRGSGHVVDSTGHLVGDYAFHVSAIDGHIAGGGAVDRVRYKIWNKATGAVVYDNQPAAADDAPPTTALQHGKIHVLHVDD